LWYTTLLLVYQLLTKSTITPSTNIKCSKIHIILKPPAAAQASTSPDLSAGLSSIPITSLVQKVPAQLKINQTIKHQT